MLGSDKQSIVENIEFGLLVLGQRTQNCMGMEFESARKSIPTKDMSA